MPATSDISDPHPALFHPAVQAWLEASFASATPVQSQAWPAIAADQNTLIAAPTGSGKTLAAFLAVIDKLVRRAADQRLEERTYVVYVSPLKALSNDIEKNLEAPLSGILEHALVSGSASSAITTGVRTGDTPAAARERMRRKPPHILVTTPESLYILLTSDSGCSMLRQVQHVIVDEIHALAGNKRGAHLSLSLERLAALAPAGEKPPVRIGLSATQRPIERVARFLLGGQADPTGHGCTIIDSGHRREMSLKLMLGGMPLEAIMSAEAWASIYDQIIELSRSHRTILVFANTRRTVERVAKALEERMEERMEAWRDEAAEGDRDDRTESTGNSGSLVDAHHGSLSKEHRLNAEQRLKAGELRIMVASASLELGIDIGDVDLVVQLGSPGSIAALLQRVGRAGHRIDALPKGLLVPTSRDDLVECCALLDAIRLGELDELVIPTGPLDVLAQQIIAEVGNGEISESDLFDLVRRADPYRDLDTAEFDALLSMLADGFSTQRGRRGAYLYRDVVNRLLRPRKSARLAAVTNAGAIPDLFDSDVILHPEEIFIGTLNEDFAFETLPGDIFQLGNSSYRVLRSERGKVHVEDARGQPPNIPFWFGEAPGRSDLLSASVSRLRQRAEQAYRAGDPHRFTRYCADQIGLETRACEQLNHYLESAHAALDGLPSTQRIIFERFFDEVGDMHLVIHSPFGSRINKAWGLALRKRFCRSFNFELQAAAQEDSIVLSLGSTHSFELETVARYLSHESVRQVLIQAVLDSPIFESRWRWVSNIALAVLRFRSGKKVPAQFQRSDAEDLIAVVFPDQLACLENIRGDREIPDHPLVQQALTDSLTEAMDIDGLEQVLKRMAAGDIALGFRELTEPSPLAREILTAKPYAFLDPAPAEERRTQMVDARRQFDPVSAGESGLLDAAAIAQVRDEAWPRMRNADELHDAMHLAGYLTEPDIAAVNPTWLAELTSQRRALNIGHDASDNKSPKSLWIAVERVAQWQPLLPETALPAAVGSLAQQRWDADSGLREIVRSRLELVGPIQAAQLSAETGLSRHQIDAALMALENSGVAMQGHYETDHRAVNDQKQWGPKQWGQKQWIDRRLLARIHRLSLARRREAVAPVNTATFQAFLFHWQGLDSTNSAQSGPEAEGIEALAAILSQLEGCHVNARAWEEHVLPARMRDYNPMWLDFLCQSGRFVWRAVPGSVSLASKTSFSVANTPITLISRDRLDLWPLPEQKTSQLSARATLVRDFLAERGASFETDIVNGLAGQASLLPTQLQETLGELIHAGLITNDGFQGLRDLLTSRHRQGRHGRRGKNRRRPLASAPPTSRWSLVGQAAVRPDIGSDTGLDKRKPDSDAPDLESLCQALLRRWGVVNKAIAKQERAPLPDWYRLRYQLQRMEARGQILGGRFVDSLWGEQFALPEAANALRQQRERAKYAEKPVYQLINASDPLNLSRVFDDGQRIPARRGNRLLYRNGELVAAWLNEQAQMLIETDANTRSEFEAQLRQGRPSASIHPLARQRPPSP